MELSELLLLLSLIGGTIFSLYAIIVLVSVRWLVCFLEPTIWLFSQQFYPHNFLNLYRCRPFFVALKIFFV